MPIDRMTNKKETAGTTSQLSLFLESRQLEPLLVWRITSMKNVNFWLLPIARSSVNTTWNTLRVICIFTREWQLQQGSVSIVTALFCQWCVYTPCMTVYESTMKAPILLATRLPKIELLHSFMRCYFPVRSPSSSDSIHLICTVYPLSLHGVDMITSLENVHRRGVFTDLTV